MMVFLRRTAFFFSQTWKKASRFFFRKTKPIDSVSLAARFFNRRYLVLGHDLFVAALALPLALWMRVGTNISHFSTPFVLKHVLVYTLISLGIYLWIQLYRGIWRYVSWNEWVTVALAVTYIGLLYLPLMFLMRGVEALPRSVVGITWGLHLFALSFSRFTYRILQDRLSSYEDTEQSSQPQSRVILIGINEQTEFFIRSARQNPYHLYEVVGIVDDKPPLVGRFIHGIEIMGTLKDLPDIIRHLNAEGLHPHHLVMTRKNLQNKAKIDLLLKISSEYKVDLTYLPSLPRFKKRHALGLRLRPLSIEDLWKESSEGLEDGRLHSFLHHRRILITGADRLITTKLAKKLLAYKPAHLSLVSSSDTRMTRLALHLEHDLEDTDISLSTLLWDIKDAQRVEEVIVQEKPDIIFHGEEIEHESFSKTSPQETLWVNTIGAKNVAEAALKHKVKNVVLLSNESALLEDDFLGESKRMAEKYFQALDQEKAPKTPSAKGSFFSIIRLSSLLGITDSALYLLQKELKEGGPLIISSPEDLASPISLDQAADLILQAVALREEEPHLAGKIFMIQPAEPLKMLSLAEQMIQLAGFKPHEDIEIKFKSLSPLHTPFTPSFETLALKDTSIPKLKIGTFKGPSYEAVKKEILSLEKLLQKREAHKSLQAHQPAA